MSTIALTVVSGETIAIGLSIPGVQGPIGSDTLPSGGTVGQLIIKQSSVDYDAAWTTSISGVTINSSIASGLTLQGTVSGGTFVSSTLSGATVNAPAMSGGTINNATLSGSTVDACTIVNSTVSGTTIFASTLSGVVTNVGTVSGGTYTSPSISGATIFASTLSGNTITGTTLDVNGDVTISDKIIHAGDTNTAIRFPAADTVTVETNGAERARIDSSGRLLVGTNSAVPVGGYGAEDIQSYFQSGGAAASIAVISTGNNTNASVLHLSKSRGGTSTVVNNNDSIGSIRFSGADGTDLLSIAAVIKCEVDGTPGASDMPGRLVFFTTADGASSPTERMRIDSSGNVGIGDSSPSTRGRLSVIATTGVGRQFVVTTAGASQMRFDDNNARINLELQNYGMSAANNGAIISWSLGDSLANANTAGSITVAAEGIWGATSASRDSYMAFSTTLDGSVGERVRITSAGNVGIGTSAPGAALHITSTGQATSNLDTSASINAIVSDSGNASNNGGSLVFAANSGAWRFAAIKGLVIDGSTNTTGDLAFSTRNAITDAALSERLRITSAGVLQIADAGNIQVGTTTGTKIGTATTQKIGFYNATPVVQPTAVADATDATTVITQLNALLTRMRNLGLIAT
jgi:hypothetical protein